MGAYLTPELLKMGYMVHVTSRSVRKNDGDITYITGDAKDQFFLGSLLNRKYDAIVDFMVYSTREFLERAPLFLNNTKHYIFLSSYRVFAENDQPLVESSSRLLETSTDAEYLNTDEYALAKARQEDILRASNARNWTIIRPSITYGNGRLQLGVLEANTVLFRAINNLAVVLPEEMLNKKTTMTWAGDVASMIARLVLNEKAYGDDFNVVTEESVTWRKIVEIYEQSAGLRLKPVSLNVFLNKVFQEGRYQLLYDRMFNRVLDNKKVLKITGLKQNKLMKISDGLAFEITEFLKKPNFKNLAPTLNAKMDRLTADYSSRLFKSLKHKVVYNSYRINPILTEAIKKLIKKVVKRRI